MSPEVQYDYVEKQSELKHPLRRGRAPIVPNFPYPQFTPKIVEDEQQKKLLRQELAEIQQVELQQSQERFAAGLALQLFLNIALPHAGLALALLQETTISLLDDPTGDDIDQALLRGALGHGVTSVTGVG